MNSSISRDMRSDTRLSENQLLSIVHSGQSISIGEMLEDGERDVYFVSATPTLLKIKSFEKKTIKNIWLGELW